jgi:thiol-disulfide isomerase/thioredoxin
MTNDNTPKKTICCIVAFVFIFIILIIAIFMTTCTQEGFTDIINSNTETMKNVLTGGIHYMSLNSNNDLLKILTQKNKVALVAVLAPWCGYCKHLKKSGILKDVAKKYPVLVIDDKHPQTQDVMNILQANGFPAIGIFTKTNLLPYRGPRNLKEITNTLAKYQRSQAKLKERFTAKGGVISVPNNVTPEMVMEQIKVHHSKGNKVTTVFLADWCGYCKKLKQEKFMEKLAKMGVIVYAIEDTHPMAKKLKIKGFPSILLWKGANYKKYNGERDPKSVLSAF